MTFRSGLLVLLVGAVLQLAPGVVAAAGMGTVNPPGQVSVMPQAVVVGSVGNTLTFSYLPGAHGISDGTVTIDVPQGWTPPTDNAPGAPGNVEVNSGKIAIAKRRITVTDVTLCKSPCSLTLTYADASVPATTGTATFPTKVAKQGKPLELLTPAPSVLINQSGCNPVSVTAPGPPSLKAAPGTCLSAGTEVSLVGKDFDPKSLGLILECNDTPDQPTVFLRGLNLDVPVSCTGLSDSHSAETNAHGSVRATWSAVVGTTGPPCGQTGDLVTPCPATDSSGGSPEADAAAYPCPPTVAQRAAGASCTLSLGDEAGKTQSVDVSFLLPPPPIAAAAATYKSTSG